MDGVCQLPEEICQSLRADDKFCQILTGGALPGLFAIVENKCAASADGLSSSGKAKKGSSRITGKRSFDLKEEEFRVAVPISHPFHYLDPVVNALKLSGMHRPAHSGENPSPVQSKSSCKANQRFDGTAAGHGLPSAPRRSPAPRIRRLPEFLEARFQHIDGH